MPPEPFEQAEYAQRQARQRQESITAATAAAEAATATYEDAGGQIRVTVNGRLRIEQLYVSERLLRSPELAQLLVPAVNEALRAAQVEFAERFRAELTPETAGLLGAAEELVETLRDGSAADVLPRAERGR